MLTSTPAITGDAAMPRALTPSSTSPSTLVATSPRRRTHRAEAMPPTTAPMPCTDTITLT